MPAVARRGTVRAVLTALLVDVLGALGEGNDLVAGEDLGAVRLLAARGAEGLAAGVAEAHGIQILRGHSGAVVVVRGGGGTAGCHRRVPPPCPPPARPHRLGTAPVAVGALHVLLAVGRAVHEELQEPVHGGQTRAPPHHRGVPAGRRWGWGQGSAPALSQGPGGHRAGPGLWPTSPGPGGCPRVSASPRLTRRGGSAGGRRWRGRAGSWHRNCGSSRAGRGAGRARGTAGTPAGARRPSPAPSSSPAGRRCPRPSAGLPTGRPRPRPQPRRPAPALPGRRGPGTGWLFLGSELPAEGGPAPGVPGKGPPGGLRSSSGAVPGWETPSTEQAGYPPGRMSPVMGCPPWRCPPG